ncbi:hypothetical protein NIES4103_60600 [Nostoc sp. NIES-4103]|nr:hypothetical protein NIES4103_60600 [Nostoc sp. NIES-4103]
MRATYFVEIKKLAISDWILEQLPMPHDATCSTWGDPRRSGSPICHALLSNFFIINWDDFLYSYFSVPWIWVSRAVKYKIAPQLEQE